MGKLSFESIGRRLREFREDLPKWVPGSLKVVKETRERIAARMRENHAQTYAHGAFTGVPGIDTRHGQKDLDFRGQSKPADSLDDSDEYGFRKPASNLRSNVMMLAFVVSTAINGYLALQVSQKQDSENQAKEVATQVREELARQRREWSGKIAFTPSEFATVQRTAESAEETLKSTKYLLNRVSELEGEVARLNGVLAQGANTKKSVKMKTSSAVQKGATPTKPRSIVSTKNSSAGYSHNELEAYVAKRASEFLAEGITIHYDPTSAQVVFIDSNNINERGQAFGRTLDARNVSKSQIKEWIEAAYMRSIDEIAMRQGVLPQGAESRLSTQDSSLSIN